MLLSHNDTPSFILTPKTLQMKHVYILSALMAFATVASAQTSAVKASLARQLMGQKKAVAASTASKSLKAYAPTVAKVDADTYKFEVGDIISQTPQGDYQELFKTTSMWRYGEDGLDTLTLKGAIAAVVYGDNNQVWMKNPVAAYPTNTWIHGTVTGNELHFPLPQPILR